MHLSTDWIELSDRKLTVWRVQRSWIGSYQAKKKNQSTKHMMIIPTTRCAFVFWGLVLHSFVPFVLFATVAGRKNPPTTLHGARPPCLSGTLRSHTTQTPRSMRTPLSWRAPPSVRVLITPHAHVPKKNRQEAPDLQRELTWLEKLQGKLQGSASKLTPGHIYLLFVFLLPCVYIQMRYDASCKIQIPSVLPSLPPSLPAFLSVRVYNNLMDVRCSIYTMSIFMYYLYHVNVQLITYVREGSRWSSTCLRSAVAMACGNKGGNSAVTRSHEHMTYRSI
jgi:hypothetical protein